MSTRKPGVAQDRQETVNLLDRRAAAKVTYSVEPNENVAAEEQFDRALMDYYVSKSVEADHSSFDAIVDNALQSEKVAQKILAMPAMTAHQVLAKLSILDAELLSDLDCEAPVDRRHIVAFATLKVDIVRLLAQKEC